VLSYILLPQPAEALPNLLLKPQRWSDALLHAANPVREHPVMLGIEDIVDRALTKTNGATNTPEQTSLKILWSPLRRGRAPRLYFWCGAFAEWKRAPGARSWHDWAGQ